ncbi:Mitochondrial outer membrane protein iml2 [Talaromyces atroroseus]|uniref:Inclusion body clearance protein IML2 n=1 Tax=Talaromyces atroroseus TaxID=1441469 RepID=A0A225AFG7_TALAT|nr:Mitochondrial outer membrane protein iml2 [Talaromyces atroroseus]OKL60061.1 Mitochondrial outer membrane protein iml2 [Talaromyces atroroseus]
MNRVGSWLYGRKPGNGLIPALELATQIQDLEQALEAATLILNDDVDGAEMGLSKGDSSFHKTGKGVVGFLRALLGFEQEIMRQASERLSDAETSAYNDMQRVTHASSAPDAFHSKIYDVGTEYALCQAMAQIMIAVVGVLNESLTESLKGFYKMRKAHATLDAIVRMEERYLLNNRPPKSRTAPANLETEKHSLVIPTTKPSGKHTGSKSDQDLRRNMAELKLVNESQSTPSSAPSSNASSVLGETLTHDADAADIFSHPIDSFIHTGASLCLGMLLAMLSTLPPTFSRLLAVVGFRGDKERGLRMLWQASKAHSLIGAVAGLGILGYYNGFIRLLDIIPDATSDDEAGIEGYPMERLLGLLNTMRTRFPRSQLWLLEEARMKSANRDVEAAFEILKNSTKSPLKQVEALQAFEKSLDSMYLHRYEDCAKYFIECTELNSWSPALYLYIAGSAYVVLYRQTLSTDPSAAQKYAEKARECIRKAPTVAGKKRLMARQLPFEVFVTRKITKWEAHAKEWKVDVVDAVGVDPIEEMIFLWNGYSRMGAEGLKDSLQKLEWSENDLNKDNNNQHGDDEKAIIQLLRAAILRALRKHAEAKDILKQKVLVIDRSVFKGHLRDNWVLPAAHFEVAANLWMERPNYVSTHISPFEDSLSGEKKEEEGIQKHNITTERQQIQECDEHLEKAAKWESYDLDTRIGLKVTAARDAISKWYASHPVNAE